MYAEDLSLKKLNYYREKTYSYYRLITKEKAPWNLHNRNSK